MAEPSTALASANNESWFRNYGVFPDALSRAMLRWGEIRGLAKRWHCMD